MSEEPRRIEEYPDAAKVVVAHPDNELYAVGLARAQGTDYMLSVVCDHKNAYILDTTHLFVRGLEPKAEASNPESSSNPVPSPQVTPGEGGAR